MLSKILDKKQTQICQNLQNPYLHTICMLFAYYLHTILKGGVFEPCVFHAFEDFGQKTNTNLPKSAKSLFAYYLHAICILFAYYFEGGGVRTLRFSCFRRFWTKNKHKSAKICKILIWVSFFQSLHFLSGVPQ